MLIFIILLILHFTGKARLSCQGIMIITGILAPFWLAVFFCTAIYVDIPVWLRITLIILALGIFGTTLLIQNIIPADPFSYKKLPSEAEWELSGGKRLIITGLIAALVNTVGAAVTGLISFLFAAFSAVSWIITGLAGAVLLFTFIMRLLAGAFMLLFDPIGLFAALSMSLTNFLLQSTETIFAALRQFFIIMLYISYIYLVNGIIRTTLKTEGTTGKKALFTLLALIPNVNVILGICMLVSINKRIKLIRQPPVFQQAAQTGAGFYNNMNERKM